MLLLSIGLRRLSGVQLATLGRRKTPLAAYEFKNHPFRNSLVMVGN